jgi:hypothetical protein
VHQHVKRLIDLHQALVGAFAEGDANRVVTLLADREQALRELKTAYEETDDVTRAAMQPRLATLQRLDQELQQQAREARDRLGDDLRRGAAPRPSSRTTTVTGVFDRQA